MTNPRKKSLRHRFSKAANTYDNYALVQKASGAKLISGIPAHFAASEIFEIGCGTGNYTRLVARRFPGSRLTALDFSESMVEWARKKCSEAEGIRFLCRDGEEFLQQNTSSYDLITSNATLQWFDDLPAALRCIASCLTGEGMLHASLFGPRTMNELAQALAELFGERIELAAVSFHDEKVIRQMAETCFDEVDIFEVIYKRSYTSLRDLLGHIRRTGTGGYHSSMPLLTRSRRNKLDEWFAGHGGYEVSYQVFFLSASNAKVGSRG